VVTIRWFAVLSALVLVGCAAEQPGVAQGDGHVAESLSVTDTDHVALSNLDPALLAAVQAAAVDAQADGIELKITSGWRSREYQQQLLDEAVSKYGSLEAAREFVNTPDKSTHVTGDAVDIGPTDAADWVIRHGSDYGLCQTYANEIWHFELMTEPGGECPTPRDNAAS
jgi:hypothetical protein